MRDCVSFLDLEFDRVSQDEVILQIARLARQPAFTYLVTPNVDHVVRLHAEPGIPDLWDCYQNASLRLCDSRILKGLARLSGVSLSLVTGSDLTARLLDENMSEFQEIGVIGGTEDLMGALRCRFPQRLWHHHRPPMGVLENVEAQQRIVDFVAATPARLFLFAIGAPQSELVCRLVTHNPRAQGVGLCIGASLEFVTGTKKRAPGWMQRAGLEWLFRLLSEPRRLWGRYAIEGPKIFQIWWKWRLSAASAAKSASTHARVK